MIDKMFFWDSLSSVIWQYDNSEALQSLLQYKQDFYDKSTGEFFTNYIKDVVNINTANAFGLTVWGRLLQMPRPYYFDENNNKVMFNDDLYKLVLKAKLLKLKFPPTIPNINKFLQLLFPDQRYVYCTDNFNMTIIYHFASIPTAFVNVNVDLNDFFMRPAGVKIITITGESKYFAFGSYDKENESLTATGFGSYDSDTDWGGFASYNKGE